MLNAICLTTNVQLKGHKTFQQPKSSETPIRNIVGWTDHAAKAKYALLLDIRLLDISLKYTMIQINKFTGIRCC